MVDERKYWRYEKTVTLNTYRLRNHIHCNQQHTCTCNGSDCCYTWLRSDMGYSNIRLYLENRFN